jgi:hypothetical protein
LDLGSSLRLIERSIGGESGANVILPTRGIFVASDLSSIGSTLDEILLLLMKETQSVECNFELRRGANKR